MLESTESEIPKTQRENITKLGLIEANPHALSESLPDNILICLSVGCQVPELMFQHTVVSDRIKDLDQCTG